MPAFRKSSNNKRLVLSVKSSGFPAWEGFDSLLDLRSARAPRGRRSERQRPRPPLSRPPWGDLRSRDGNARPRGLTGFTPVVGFAVRGGRRSRLSVGLAAQLGGYDDEYPSFSDENQGGQRTRRRGRPEGPGHPPHGSLTVSQSAQGSHRAAWVPCDLDPGILGGPMTRAFFLLRNI